VIGWERVSATIKRIEDEDDDDDEDDWGGEKEGPAPRKRKGSRTNLGGL
jgi:hypothetical protein